MGRAAVRGYFLTAGEITVERAKSGTFDRERVNAARQIPNLHRQAGRQNAGDF
jgi:hypothetical protein